MNGKISQVATGSIAQEMGILPGDILLSLNGQKISDLIDFNFHEAEEELELEIQKPDGQIWLCQVEKDYDEDLGISFEANVFDGIRRCCNHCIFCFEDQLQPQPRPSLHAKDDDYRMSFLEGNFITCTNMGEEDLLRIERMHLSPLYISVHTTDPVLRGQMLGHKKAMPILPTLQRLKNMGCLLHTQIVLCPDFNDGLQLQQTLNDLYALRPQEDSGGVISAAVVPVGLTRFCKNPQMRLFTSEEAGQILDSIEIFQKKCLAEFGSRFVFPADELYVKAGREFPSADTYEDFPQLENGIGMAALFRREYELLKDTVPRLTLPGKTAIITGINGKAAIAPCIDDICRRSGNDIDLLCIENTFYGSSVTATGLLTASDLVSAIPAGKYDRLLLPANMLKFDEDIFLDDMKMEEVSAKLHTPIFSVPCDAGSLLQALFGDEI